MSVDLAKLQALADRGRKLLRQPQARAGETWYRTKNEDGERAEIYIYGVIGSDWDDGDVTAASFVRDLKAITAPAIDLHVNSPGGLVFDGVTIYSALRNHPATVDVYVDGVAASAASFVAMAGDTVAIEKPAKMFIHDAQGLVIGNAADMLEMATLLDDLSDTIAGIYADHAGGTVAQWRAAMKAETWYSSAHAVAAGLADRVNNDDSGGDGGPGNNLKTSPAQAREQRRLHAAAWNTLSTKGRTTDMTIEELHAAMQAIVDGAQGRSLTDDEVKQYEALENELAEARTEQVKKRQKQYNAPVPDNIQATANATAAKKSASDELDRAFVNYLRTGIPSAELQALQVTNAQSSGSDPAGGYMVPPGFRTKLVEVMKQFGGLAAEADSFTTDTGATLEFPSVDDTANSGQITAEGAAVSGGADLVFGTVNLGAFKYTSSGASNAPVKVSVELLQDSAFDVESLLARKLGERIARKQASDWVIGGGTTLPFGVLRTAVTPDVTITGATVSYDNLVDVEAALDGAYEPNAKWLMSRGIWALLRKVKDTAGRPLLMEQSVAGAGGRIERSLLGYPVVLDNACPTNAINTNFLGLGDWREAYVIRRVSNLVVMVNPYSSAAAGQVEFHAWERADGNVQNRKGYSVLARGAS